MLGKKGWVSVLAVLWMALPAHQAEACTTFCLRNGDAVVYGKNYDWQNGNGFLMVNQRGVATGSLERFARASAMMKSYRPESGRTPVEHAFEILDRVAQGAYTQWSIVYDLRDLEVHFKTRANRNQRSVKLRSFDFRCGAPLQMLDLEGKGAGDVTARFVGYTPEKNRELVFRSYEITPEFRKTPKELVTATATHAERTTCARKP